MPKKKKAKNKIISFNSRLMGRKAKNLQKDLQKKSSVFKREAKENLDKAKKDLQEAEKKVKEYMKKNPAKAAAIAAGIGAVVGAGIGALISRRKK